MSDMEATGDEYELQVARMEALYERIADRLGEHDAARNVSEGASEEQVTILTAGWPVEDLARFIVDDLEYDFIAPIQRDALAAKMAAVQVQVNHLDLVAKQVRVRQVFLDEDGVGEAPSLADELWIIAYNLRAALTEGTDG